MKPFVEGSVSEGIRKRERTLDHPDLHRISRQHLDHIEAEGNVGHIKEPQPVKGSPSDKLLLLPIHGIKGAAKFFGSAGLHLGKDKRVMVPADEIDFPSRRCAEVSAENLPTKPFQMA
jgi:hypothetical protein